MSRRDSSWLELPELNETDRDLQLVAHDPSANAPERDKSSEAPELVQPPAYEQSQTIEQFKRERHLSSQAPEPYRRPYDGELGHNPELEGSEHGNGRYISFCGKRRLITRKKFWFGLCGIWLIIGIAVGLGTGLGISASNNRSTGPPPVDPNAAGGNQFRPHGILNNTSFAAASTSDGTKHVIFQDSSGLLRDNVFSKSTNSWVSSESFVIPVNAKNNTPLAVFVAKDKQPYNEQVIMFYINQNTSKVDAATFPTFGNGRWAQGFDTKLKFDLSKLDVIDNPRLLSVTRIPWPIDATNSAPYNQYSLWIMLEAPGGKVSAFLGNMTTAQATSQSEVEWVDKTKDLDPHVVSPFYALEPRAPSYFAVDLSFMDARKLGATSTSSMAPDGIIHWNQPSNITSNATTNVGSNAYDLVMPFVYDARGGGAALPMVAWVNGTKLSMHDAFYEDFLPLSPKDVPEAPFPYPRLATMTPANSSLFLLYHQINSTTIAEDSWDSQIRVWKSNYITVDTW